MNARRYNSEHGDDIGYVNAPGIGAFYFEDAIVELIKTGGDDIVMGRIAFTLPPRRSAEAAGLAEAFEAYGGRSLKDAAGFPERSFRVVRCSARVCADKKTYDFLLTPAIKIPSADERINGGIKGGTVKAGGHE